MADAGIHSIESKITEVYFCNFVLESLNPKVAIICVPEDSTLRWLTASSKTDDITNKIGNALVEFGDYNRRIEHLKRSNWKVSVIYLSEWRKLDPKARLQYVQNHVLV